MKHNVGDKVRVHTLEWFEKNCTKTNDGYHHKKYDKVFFIPDMEENCGKIITIKDVIQNKYYRIAEDIYHYEDWVFEEDDVKEETNWEHYQKEIEKFIANGTPCDKCPASKYCDTVQKCGEIFCHWANSKYVPEEPKPTYRAWTKDTFPLHVGAEIKVKGDTSVWGIIGYDTSREKVVVVTSSTKVIPFSTLFEDFEMADGTPCGELISGEETK